MRRSYMYIWKSFGRNDTNAWIIIMTFRNVIMSGDPPTFVKIPNHSGGMTPTHGLSSWCSETSSCRGIPRHSWKFQKNKRCFSYTKIKMINLRNKQKKRTCRWKNEHEGINSFNKKFNLISQPLFNSFNKKFNFKK